MDLLSYNPATGEVVGVVPVTDPALISDVVRGARLAQPAWNALGFEGRRNLLLPAGDELVRRADELGLLLTREMGKPLREAVGEVRGCGEPLAEELTEIADALAPETLEDTWTRTTLYHDPYGVVAAITPWNFPMSMAHWMVIPALMAGNTVILKPSEETPLIAQAWVEVLNHTLPPGVLQIIHGNEVQGKALVAADVDLIAFTGSRAAGQHIMAAAAPGLKRVLLELGGKDPLLVLEDADLKAAARFAARNSFRNAGQVCVSTERIYVKEQVAEEFEREVVAETARMKVGDGLETGVQIGPMISRRQKDHVLRQLEAARQQGAHIIAGGEDSPGNFMIPTVVTHVSHQMDLMKEETFGPVACIARITTDDEAVRLANDTPYGLGAVVFGAEDHAERVARRLDAGMIGINRGCSGAAGSPWVGAKQSGIGFHSGRDGHRQFTQVRVISRPR